MNVVKRRGGQHSNDPTNSEKFREDDDPNNGRFSSIFTKEQLLIIAIVAFYQLYCLQNISLNVEHVCPSASTNTTSSTLSPALESPVVSTLSSTSTCAEREYEIFLRDATHLEEKRMWLGARATPVDYNDTSKLDSAHPCSVESLNRPGPNSHPVPKHPRKSIVIIEHRASNTHKVFSLSFVDLRPDLTNTSSTNRLPTKSRAYCRS